ncbi:hypothetical protein PPACK8108_LOCUS22713 [Phakopsora pachyrhizi]|uniref:Uncharacterized protein n=1 Tax=Phakopsora pachyrhizi TaxID=170000 RepID=A0AAV0BMJ9_PHAPC|nr:hypothetical protein PPACK8108_LOCUS22713 [Phakopsora pachyrhizi]
MDLPVSLDLHRVVFVQVGLSTLASVSVSPSYNLPIHLYGLYNIEADLNQSPGASEGLRQYSILLVVTFGLDLIWMYNWSNTASAIPFILILIGLVIKPITLLTCLNQLNRTGNGFTGINSNSNNYQYQQQPRLSHFEGNVGSTAHQQVPVWATSQQSHQFRSKPPGPSAVSHQAISSNSNSNPNNTVPTTPSSTSFSNSNNQDFVVDHNEEDAQNLSDDEVLKKAKRELDFRIAQKQQQQQKSLLESNLIGGSGNNKNSKLIDGSGYHTLE